MRDLSVLIPSRNEMFLNHTIQDVLSHIEADTEVIVVLDGAWPVEPIPDHERLVIVHMASPVGQRRATNIAARVSEAKYVMKLDAHCSVGQGFDRIMLEDMQPDWTMVPNMKNLWVFDWVCPDGHRRYQGPSGPCEECGKETKREIVWKAKRSPNSTSYCFNSEPKFQYFGEFKKRPEGKGNLTETMSLQGSCWLLTREKYFELDVCDEEWGTWGSQGIEVACKVWLSGGRVICNHRTHYAHAFRTQGKDWGFPYPLSGDQVAHAKKMARDTFFENAWPKQIRPLSWLLERFWPVPGWTEEELSSIQLSGELFYKVQGLLPKNDSVATTIFNSPELVANHANPNSSIVGRGENMPPRTMSLSPVDDSNASVRQNNIVQPPNKFEMEGITTGGSITNMMKDKPVGPPLVSGNFSDEPSIDDSMYQFVSPVEDNLPISLRESVAGPQPAIAEGVDGINVYSAEQARDSICIKGGDCEIISSSHSIPPSQVSDWLEPGRLVDRSGLSIITHDNHIVQKCILYYTDNRLDPKIMKACQEQIEKAELPVMSVSLSPLGWGNNIAIDAKRGPLTLHKQILAGLEAIDADVIFFAEHDVLYHPGHFDFMPMRSDKFYYNTNVWKVRASDGHAVWTDNLQQTSGLCAYRSLLLEHYRRRVAEIEENGFDRHYEPGEKTGPYKSENWQSEHPNLDIRHGGNLTRAKWHPSEFRNKRYARGWKETDSVSPWYEEGEFGKLLRTQVDHIR